MDYKFVPMNKEYANEIAYHWKYQGIYSFYDMTADEEDLVEFLDETNWSDRYFVALSNNSELVGFYAFFFECGIMNIGLGLKPELTGRKIGPEFVMAGIQFGVDRFRYKQDCIMLAVASFNKRAISAYEKLGFQCVEEYIQNTNGGKFEFVKMKKVL